MDNKYINKADVANETAVTINRSDFTLGTASGLDTPLGIQRPALTVGFNETLSYFFSEYFKGLLFLAFSIFFILAIPRVFSRSGGLTIMVNRAVKRTMDISGALIGFLLTLPLWLIVPILIKLDSRGPVFYTQVRVGVNRRKENRRLCQKVGITDHRRRDRRRNDYLGQTFKVIKFRTMVTDAEKKSGPVWATKNDPRITRLGSFLRKTRMDEIPQFINILKGDMALVGPRPERPAFVEQLASKVDSYGNRLQVKPGLTGLAQVTGGYDSSVSSVAEKVKHDLEYIDNWSVWSDIKIILKTVIVVITGKGAN